MPQTFDLECDYTAFVSEFQRRAAAHEDNIWIGTFSPLSFSFPYMCTISCDVFLSGGGAV
jgi:hypothetical protein